jgi:flagellin-like protein
MIRRRLRCSNRRRGVSTIISAVLLVVITVVLVGVLYAIRLPLPNAPPTIGYSVDSNQRLPAWGDPTDCYPNLPYLPSYYLGNGSGDPRWNTYMNAWENDCENGDTGHYNQMNVSQIVITQVSRIIPLASVQFAFVCTNTTPTYISNDLVKGSLAAMSWFPGETESNLSASAPKLASCATFNASNYGGGANGVYYNRLGFFEPLNQNGDVLQPGDAIIIYIHTANSIFEAPSPIEPQSTWNTPDVDDYHGGPPWCFTVPGACTIELTDTASVPAALIAAIPLYGF